MSDILTPLEFGFAVEDTRAASAPLAESAIAKLRNHERAQRQAIGRLRSVCGEAYQLAGVVGAPAKVLDNLAYAAQGAPDLPHETFLPISPDDCAEVQRLTEERNRLLKALKEICNEDKETISRLTDENNRLFDLVRYKRSELLQDGLISLNEYAEISREGGSDKRGSVARLEGYDALAVKQKDSDAEISRLRGVIQEAMETVPHGDNCHTQLDRCRLCGEEYDAHPNDIPGGDLCEEFAPQEGCDCGISDWRKSVISKLNPAPKGQG